MVRIFATVVSVAIVSACGKTSPPPPATEKKATMTCEQIFAAPPTGDLLCDEHVVSAGEPREEIHWRSYGLPDDRGVYCDRYLEAARACSFGYAFKPPVCDVSDHENRRAELFFKDPTSMGGADYPRCARAPDTKHKTILVVSEKISR